VRELTADRASESADWAGGYHARRQAYGLCGITGQRCTRCGLRAHSPSYHCDPFDRLL